MAKGLCFTLFMYHVSLRELGSNVARYIVSLLAETTHRATLEQP